MRNYIGLIHKDADSHFGVSFPDFPGIVTAGTTLDDARAMAEEALALHVEGLVEDGVAIPGTFRPRRGDVRSGQPLRRGYSGFHEERSTKSRSRQRHFARRCSGAN